MELPADPAASSEVPRRLGEVVEVAGRRIAVVDLGEPGSARITGLLRAVEGDRELLRHIRLGGAALALAPFAAAERAPGVSAPKVALAVGDAVARRVPTAARVTIAGRAPLRSGVTEAQVGGPFAAGLAGCVDGVWLLGKTTGPLQLRVEHSGVFLGAARAGDARLETGPAADAGLPFANIASWGPDGPPSFVGRGGLGATLRGAGVRSIAVELEAGTTGSVEAELEVLLRRSPRLIERSRGGTLELGPHRDGGALGVEAGSARHGCRGCPTPCGWTFESGGTGGAVARFSGLQGFAGTSDAAACLARCNVLGMDARSAARIVREQGRVADLPDALDELVEEGTELHRAAIGLRPEQDGEPGASVHVADLAAQVGVLASPRGPEPLRSLSVFGMAAEREVPGLATTGDAAVDAGRLARWHGAFASALDVSGFCAFSGAGLLADGVVTLEDLARSLAPAGGWDGSGGVGAAALLAAGDRHLRLHASLGGGGARVDAADTTLRRAIQAHDEGLGPVGGLVGADAAQRVDGGAREAGEDRSVGRITVAVRGRLAARLGVAESLELESSAVTVRELVERLAKGAPEAAALLLSPKGHPLPAVVRGGHALSSGDLVVPGDAVELVLMVAGG